MMPEVAITIHGRVGDARAHRDDAPGASLVVSRREVISWKSTDGKVIEGVLSKPASFDPTKKYPCS